MTLPTLREGLRLPFDQFWPMYLDAHRHGGTRACHYLATFCGLSGTFLAALEGEILLMVGGILSGYCLAIVSHKTIEKNKPLIGVNPILGAFADMKMCWLAIRGRLPAEYIRLGLRPIVTGANEGLQKTLKEVSAVDDGLG